MAAPDFLEPGGVDALINQIFTHGQGARWRTLPRRMAVLAFTGKGLDLHAQMLILLQQG